MFRCQGRVEGQPNVRKSHMKYLSYATPRVLGPMLRECVQNTTWGHARCRTSGVHTDIWMLTPPRIMWKYGSPVLRTLCGLYTTSHSPLKVKLLASLRRRYCPHCWPRSCWCLRGYLTPRWRGCVRPKSSRPGRRRIRRAVVCFRHRSCSARWYFVSILTRLGLLREIDQCLTAGRAYRARART